MNSPNGWEKRPRKRKSLVLKLCSVFILGLAWGEEARRRRGGEPCKNEIEVGSMW